MARRLDTIKQAEIIAILAVGGSRIMAAKYVGCAVDSIRRRALRDPEFARRLRRAESDFELIQLSNIQQAGKKSWNASAWLLERVFPERYGKRQPNSIPVAQLQGVLDNIVDVIKKEVLDPDRCERLVKEMTKMLAKLMNEPKRKKTK